MQDSKKRVTTRGLQEQKKTGPKISALTAYDALFASIFDDAGVDILLVGDSLGNVFQGHETTIPVTLDDIIYHTRAVVRGTKTAMVVADMPFMSYQISTQEAFRNAGRLMQEAGAGAVKLEGGKRVVDSIGLMTESGIPVIGHLGLTPQSINQFGTYKVRGRTKEEAKQIYDDALLLDNAGVFAIVLEKIPAELAKSITEAVSVPTIGIGAGMHCDGQILVYSDMLGLTMDFNPRFVRHYESLREKMNTAVKAFVSDTKTGDFPNESESY